MSKFYGLLLLLLAIDCVTSTLNRYVYEFGQNVGVPVYDYEGSISLFTPVTNKDLPIPPGVRVTYVRVVVNAISPPKVDYDADSYRVTIEYSWTQISMSTYTILVKGLFVNKQ